MVLAVTAPVRQPTGPQIAQIIANSGLRTPKVRRNRASGYYTAEWCQAGLIKEVPPASFFREKLEKRFDGIRILNTQEVKASWRDGHPIIISCVHFEIIDHIREKQISLSAIIPSLLEAIQRGTTAILPLPQQPIGLLPAQTLVRPKREQVAFRQTTIFSQTVLHGLPPQSTLVLPSLHETDASPLINTRFMREHGKSALLNKLKAEAAAAGANAVQHYRMVNPPRTFPTLAEMEQDANTITIEAQS